MLKKHPEADSFQAMIKPVVYALMPSEGIGEGGVLSAILYVAGDPWWDKGSVVARQRRVFDILDQCKTRLLLLIEMNNMLSEIGKKRTLQKLNILKNISNYMQMPMVFAGSQETEDIIRNCPSLATRLDKIELSLWTDNQILWDWLANVEGTLSLRKESRLYEMAPEILRYSKLIDPFGYAGTTYAILKLAKESAVKAVKDGTEKVTSEHLRRVAGQGSHLSSISQS